MFEQAIRASEAMLESARPSPSALIPALSGCADCGTMHMIAAPVLGLCDGCGAELTTVSPSTVHAGPTLSAAI